MSRHVLISGVSQGLGLAIARAALAKGWTVSGISRRVSPEFAALQLEHGERARFQSFDLVRTDEIKAGIFETFVPFRMPLHGFVNNAAVAYDDLVTNLDSAKLREMYEVNVFAPMMLTNHVIRHMIFNQIAGSIVHVSSISVHTGFKGLSMYASTKGALEAFSKNIAREWGERGVRSNCVVAGFMDTAMSEKISGDQRQKIFKRTALKQPASLQSVAASVLFLLGDGASSITGQNVFVDSGTI